MFYTTKQKFPQVSCDDNDRKNRMNQTEQNYLIAPGSWRQENPDLGKSLLVGAIDQSTNALPPILCNILGVSDFIRLPCPAAKIIAARARLMCSDLARILWGF